MNPHASSAYNRASSRQRVGFLDFISDAFDDVWSAVTSIPVVGDAFSALGSQFQDFARTDFGKGFLAAITTYATGGLQNELIPLIGPIGAQVGAVGFALPGISQGETFGTSWTQEFVSRVGQLASIAGSQVAQEFLQEYGPELAQKFEDAAAQAGFSSDQLSQYAQQLQTISAQDLQSLADQLGVRADVLQAMIDYASGQLNMQVTALVPWSSLPAAAQSALSSVGITQDAYEQSRAQDAAKRAFDPTTGKVLGALTSVTSTMHAVSPSLAGSQLSAVKLAHPLHAIAAQSVAPQGASAVARRMVNTAAAKAQAPAPAPASTILGVPTKDALIGGGALIALGWLVKLYLL